MKTWRMHGPWLAAASVTIVAIVGVGLTACSDDSRMTATPPTEVPATDALATSPEATQATAAQASNTAAPAANNLILLKTEPDTGGIGDGFTVSGEGFAASAEVEFIWVTWDGDYVTEVHPADVKYIDRKWTEKRVSLGKAQADAAGKVTASFTVPDDFGETHDIFAVVDGEDTGKAGYRVLRTVTFSPTEGPVGTPINITVKGMGVKSFESTMATLYDHRYTGFIAGTRTRGTAQFQIRAAGPVGDHLVEVIGAATAMPYLNNWQSPTKAIPWEFRTAFKVTADNGAPPDSVDWPAPDVVTTLPAGEHRTGYAIDPPPTGTAILEPGTGPILTEAALTAEGLPPNADLDLVWVTAAGSDVNGWDVTGVPLSKATSTADGKLTTSVEIPEGLGGWHVLRVAQADTVLAEAPFRIDRSMIGASPRKVKAGETVVVQIKGLGWTQIDNGVGVTYDNAYIGFACGFGTGGDITIKLTASGGLGTHLVDLYPMIYQGARGLQGTAKPPWTYQVPFLNALWDYPGLPLGYNLPIFRFAFEIVP